MKKHRFRQLILTLAIMVLVILFAWGYHSLKKKDEDKPVNLETPIEAPENSWYCEEGEWKKSGDPSQPKPPGECYYANTLENAGAGLNLSSPNNGEEIDNPVTVSGKVQADWFKSDKIMIYIKDQKGNNLAKKEIVSDQKEGVVNFEQNIEYSTPDTPSGSLVITKGEKSSPPRLSDFKRLIINFNTYEK